MTDTGDSISASSQIKIILKFTSVAHDVFSKLFYIIEYVIWVRNLTLRVQKKYEGVTLSTEKHMIHNVFQKVASNMRVNTYIGIS